MSTKPSFAAAFQELQTLTAEFEKGELDLETAIPKFKRAAELAKILKVQLLEFETQIEEINVGLKDDTLSVAELAKNANNPNIEF